VTFHQATLTEVVVNAKHPVNQLVKHPAVLQTSNAKIRISKNPNKKKCGRKAASQQLESVI